VNEPVTRDQVSQLVATFQELRAEGRSLMASLRSSLYELRAQHARLHEDLNGRPPGARPALEGTPHPPATLQLRLDYGMTPREVEVALLLAQGCANSTVAARLGISRHTARHHTQRVLGKLGVHSRAEAGARLRLDRLG
jgi:DNA-binding NarL/FixJ family response regulator